MFLLTFRLPAEKIQKITWGAILFTKRQIQLESENWSFKSLTGDGKHWACECRGAWSYI